MTVNKAQNMLEEEKRQVISCVLVIISAMKITISVKQSMLQAVLTCGNCSKLQESGVVRKRKKGRKKKTDQKVI